MMKRRSSTLPPTQLNQGPSIFDSEAYWRNNPDVARENFPAWHHYRLHGNAEGRRLPVRRSSLSEDLVWMEATRSEPDHGRRILESLIGEPQSTMCAPTADQPQSFVSAWGTLDRSRCSVILHECDEAIVPPPFSILNEIQPRSAQNDPDAPFRQSPTIVPSIVQIRRDADEFQRVPLRSYLNLPPSVQNDLGQPILAELPATEPETAWVQAGLGKEWSLPALRLMNRPGFPNPLASSIVTSLQLFNFRIKTSGDEPAFANLHIYFDGDVLPFELYNEARHRAIVFVLRGRCTCQSPTFRCRAISYSLEAAWPGLSATPPIHASVILAECANELSQSRRPLAEILTAVLS